MRTHRLSRFAWPRAPFAFVDACRDGDVFGPVALRDVPAGVGFAAPGDAARATAGVPLAALAASRRSCLSSLAVALAAVASDLATRASASSKISALRLVRWFDVEVPRRDDDAATRSEDIVPLCRARATPRNTSEEQATPTRAVRSSLVSG